MMLVMIVLLLVSCSRDYIKVNDFKSPIEEIDIVLNNFDIKNDEIDLLFNEESQLYLSFKSNDNNKRLNHQVETLMALLQENHDYIQISHSNITVGDYRYMSFVLENDDYKITVAQLANRNMVPIQVEGSKKLKLQQDIVLYIEER